MIGLHTTWPRTYSTTCHSPAGPGCDGGLCACSEGRIEKETANRRRVQNPDDSELPATRYPPQGSACFYFYLGIQKESKMRD